MKKVIMKSLLGLFIATTSIHYSFAQTTAMLPVIGNHQNTDHTNRLLSKKLPPPPESLAINEVSSKAIRTFHKYFKDASNQQWFYMDKNKFLTTFTNKEGLDSRALFANNGYMHYAISYSDEQCLPKNLKRQIKSLYVDFTIGKVSEVSADGRKVWIINLEDEDHIAIIRLTPDGLIDELEHYNKNSVVNKKE